MSCEQCAKQPACLGLNTERPVHHTGPALFMPWSDAPGLSAHILVVRSVGQEDGPPQWGVVHEHTRRPSPVFMNADHQHLNNTRQLPSTGRSMVGRCSTAKVDFGRLTPNFPLFMNKQRRLLRALAARRRCPQEAAVSRAEASAASAAGWAQTPPGKAAKLRGNQLVCF